MRELEAKHGAVIQVIEDKQVLLGLQRVLRRSERLRARSGSVPGLAFTRCKPLVDGIWCACTTFSAFKRAHQDPPGNVP